MSLKQLSFTQQQQIELQNAETWRPNGLFEELLVFIVSTCDVFLERIFTVRSLFYAHVGVGRVDIGKFQDGPLLEKFS